MGIKTTIVLLAVLAALGAYYFFVERHKPSEQEMEQQARAVFQLDRSNIKSLEIAYAGDEIRCEKGESGWAMVSPVQAKSDETVVAALLTEISKLESDRVLSTAEAGRPEDFGLDDPDLRVSVTLSDPPDSHWVLVGDETPTGDAYYCFVDNRESIVLIPSPTVSIHFKKKPFDLRDKTALQFDIDQVVGLELSHDNVKIRGERRKGGPWKLVEPIEAKGEDTEINSVLFDLQNAKVREFLDEEPNDLAGFGLEEPAATVRLRLGAARTLASIKFGKETDEGGTVFASRSGYSNVVKVDKRLLDKVKTDFSDLRRKRLLDFATSDVASIDISKGDSLFSCVRDSAGEWTAIVPENRPLKKWKMNGVASQLSFLRAFSFVDDAEPDLGRMGLAEPQLTVTVTLMDSTATRLELGAVEEDEIYVRAEGQIAKVSDDFLQDMAGLVRDPPYVEEEEEEGVDE